MSMAQHGIVVGVDGSPASQAAADWASDEALRRHRSLHLVSARDPQVLITDGYGYLPAMVDLVVDPIEEAKALLATTAERLLAAAPLLWITTEATPDFPAAALVTLSERAYTVVLGNRGAGAVARALLGSVATQVVHHAHCPVVVVPEPAPDPSVRRGVVVGVDGSVTSELALGYAFEEASSRACRLDVVHAWWTRAERGMTADILEDLVTQQRLALSESMVGWSEKYPDVDVHRHLPIGPAVATLLEQSRDAELLVVGSRGLGGFRSLLMGSVSHGVLQHATCPVAVVRPDIESPS